ncbi:MAG: hypothetical protein J0I42_09170 [Bosea sp.]|uniref:hypothetical protein n=1 Tax=Bosea sp. (in: a-proteobacteria) TaxID=1871050 RepID=UPI001ACFED25|nr:hypothetical protein [Bosea sp. (in: a-proteobacteria)]MBN9452111.1 hypothetical protein [Bosea sp. (in: a-proteobacteria)]
MSSTSPASEPRRRCAPVLITAIMLANVASACVPRTAMRFDRYDGRSDAGAVAQFQQDDAICKGEAAKAQAMAAPIHMGRSLADAMEAGMLEGQRNQALRQIMVGCMAGRGYSMTVVTPQP